MSDNKIKDFHSWCESPMSNGYCFKRQIRFVPGPNDAFYWMPLEKPKEDDIYVRARVFDMRDGRMKSLDLEVDIPIALSRNDIAVKI